MKGNRKVMEDYVAKDFGKLLKRNALQMRRLMLSEDTDAMRVYDRNLTELPIAVDLYGAYARITDYSDNRIDDDEMGMVCDIVSRMLYVEPEKVVYHQRLKRQGKEQHGIQQEQSLETTVRENGLVFKVDLTKRIDTGLFLDQAVARSALRDVGRNLEVLNLFSYTGSFSVYAAAGGAKSVVSVDLSSTYTQWCEQNLAANGFSGGAYPCVSQDATEYIRNAAKEGRKFDVIILDPPSFSNSRKMEHDFDVQRDYIHFIELLNGLLVTGGKLLFSTNLGGFRFEKRKIRGYDVREVTRDIAAPGFSAKKSSLRSWILEKKEEVKMPLDEEVKNVVPAEEVVETAIGAVEPLIDLQDEETVASEDREETTTPDTEDDPLVLNWDENDTQEASGEFKNAKQRRYERRHPGETAAPVTPPEERTKKEDRPVRDRRPRDGERERAPRRFDNDRRRDGRSSDRERPPRRRYDEDRPPRRFDDDRRRDDRPFDRDRPPRRFNDDRRDSRPFDRDRPPRRFDDDRRRDGRSFDRDRPPRRFDDDKRRDDRPFDRDRPPRRFNDDRGRDSRPFDRDRPPRRFDEDRSRGDRPPRRFDDDRRRDDRPFDRDRPPRRFNDDRGRDSRPFDRDRPPRRFDDDRRRDDRPFDRDRPPRRFNDDRGRDNRSFDRDRPPRRFDEDRPRGDRSFDRERPPRRFDDDRKRDDRGFGRNFDRDRGPKKGGPKPYGYDRFKPTRERGGDKETFFRMDDEKKED